MSSFVLSRSERTTTHHEEEDVRQPEHLPRLPDLVKLGRKADREEDVAEDAPSHRQPVRVQMVDDVLISDLN